MADASTTLRHAPARHGVWRGQAALALGRFRRSIVVASLMGSDMVVVAGATTVGRALTAAGETPEGSDWLPAGLLILIYLCSHLYTGCGPSPYERFRIRTFGVTAFLIFSLLVCLWRDETSPSLLASICASLFLLTCGHYLEGLTRGVLLRLDLWGAPSILVGCSTGRKLAQQLLQQPALGLRPIGFIGIPGQRAPRTALLPWLGSIAEPGRIPLRAEFLIFASVQVLNDFLRAPQASIAPHRCLLVEEVHDVQNLWLRTRTLGGFVGIEIQRGLRRKPSQLLKRMIDVVIAAAAGLLLSPVIFVLALAVKLVDAGPSFYIQERVGLNGMKLPTVKLRTMYVDAEQRLEELLARDPQARAEWQRFFKLSRDPRVLPIIGRFMRRTSLDELPQLWNVIRGDMSLVGPRPFPSYHMNGFDEEFKAIRASVLPGITGMWQVSCRGDGDLEVQKAQDLFYIRNWSIWLDIYILLQTVPVVLGTRGAK